MFVFISLASCGGTITFGDGSVSRPAPATATEEARWRDYSQTTSALRLVCLNLESVREHSSRLTRAQVIGIEHAVRNGRVNWPCDGAFIPTGSRLVGRGFVQDRDGRWMVTQTFREPGGALLYTVDPLQNAHDRRPSQYLFVFIV